jgi:hypothetical protein
MNKRYEVLDGLPTYGDMGIPITYNDELFVSEGYVVKFYKDDGSAWVANFQLGETDTFQVISSDKTNIIIVIAGGIGYVMSPNTKEAIKIIDYDISQIIKMDDGSIIMSNEADIIILDKNGKIKKKYDGVGFDGISNLRLEENILTGLVYDFESYENLDDSWIPFNINLKTDEIIIQWKNKKEEKPWWKFW